MAMNLKPAKAKSKTSFLQNVLVIAGVVGFVVLVMALNAASSANLNNVVEVAVLKESLPKDGIIYKCETEKEWTNQFEKVEMMAFEYEKLNAINSNKTSSAYDGKITNAEIEAEIARSAAEEGKTITAEEAKANLEKKVEAGYDSYNNTKYSDYREIVLWEDLGVLTKEGMYAACYIPAGRPLYFADFTKTGTQKNSYLYQMDGELIRLDITPDDFGDMVVPGDKLNIRVSYETTDYTLPTQEEYAKLMEQGGAMNETVFVTEMLFSEVAILDMINGSGESIFDLYYELLTLPEAERSAIINGDDFKSRVAPSNILLSVTAEEADRYARIKNMGGEYLITLLPRDGTTEILDALDELKVGFARE